MCKLCKLIFGLIILVACLTGAYAITFQVINTQDFLEFLASNQG